MITQKKEKKKKRELLSCWPIRTHRCDFKLTMKKTIFFYVPPVSFLFRWVPPLSSRAEVEFLSTPNLFIFDVTNQIKYREFDFRFELRAIPR